MLTKDKAQSIFARVLKFSSADETELLISGGRSALTRFANNAITQNVAEENYTLSVRVNVNGRTARATTNKFDDESIRRVVEAATNLAKVQAPDPDLLPMADASAFDGKGPAPARNFFETSTMGPQERADAVEKIVQVAHKQKLTTAGIYSTSESVDAILNSSGLVAYYTQTSAECSITMLAPDSSGWQKANSPDARNFDPVQLAEIAAQKAKASAGPQDLAPGKYTVILEPAAVLDLLGFIFWDWGGQAILDERSFLNNRVGTKLFGENISISDDVYHPLQSGAPFDGEGVRRQRVLLVEKGVVSNLVYARGTAEKVRKSEFADKVGPVRATGHGFPIPNEIGEMPMNIVLYSGVAGKSRTVDEMIGGTDEGILVTRLWYIREVDPYEKILTGMTRDGTFLVKDGQIRGGIRNFRFNQSMVALLNNVLEMGEPVRASGEESFDMVVPAMKIRDFNFTEVTKF
ncbi:MAG TPA: TldD/PmbA family protein [Terriglobales bacterium]|nr:TldD/PmbA family protein [Terriglobales bacterium]